MANGTTSYLATALPVDAAPKATGLRQVGAASKDLEGSGSNLTAEASTLNAQIQRLVQTNADPGRTDGLAVVARPGLDGTAQPTTAGTTPPAPVQMGTPTGAPGWGDELGHRVMWLVGQRESTAELRLDPPALGNLEIRIRQRKDETSVSFVVQSSSAREAVESAIPRLREFFADAGLSLQSMDVSQRQPGERHSNEGDRGTGGDSERTADRFVGSESAPRTVWRGGGLIDTYA